MNVASLLFALFQFFCGVYLILLFTGVVKPKEQNEKFEILKSKYGKLFIFGGILCLSLGAMSLINLSNLNL